jgi:hypothetical protein
MMSEMTYEQWVEKYKPIKNHLVTDDTTSFETYGEELQFVILSDDYKVWTELDGDNGVYLVSGYHIVNRISYYVTEIPWQEDEDICITVCEFVVCDCFDPDDEETEPDQDCDQCGGDGTYTDWK